MARFNPLPHAEGDCLPRSFICLSGKRFNPLPHAEGDFGCAIQKVASMEFQSTPSRRGRPCRQFPVNTPVMSQSTPSRRGRPPAKSQPFSDFLFQSTPSRRGRPVRKFSVVVIADVSIHSLTQRETYGANTGLYFWIVSIHSLTQRETDFIRFKPVCVQFQSTPSRRGRHYQRS